MTASSPPDPLALARRLVALAVERRAEDPVLLDVRELVDYTDFFVLLTGRSLRQNQAIAEHLVRSLKADGRYAMSKSGVETGTWICLDFGDAVVHVFDPATRARYDLELLWADAPRPSPVAEEPKGEPKRKRTRTVRKAAVGDADAGNAPDSERPPLDEPEAPSPKPARRPRRATSTKSASSEKPRRRPAKAPPKKGKRSSE
jgi:ribosome-associated protein